MYEYSFLTGVATITRSDDHVEHFLDDLHPTIFESVKQQLAEAGGGGWELVSHSYLILGGRLVGTFLIRRSTDHPAS